MHFSWHWTLPLRHSLDLHTANDLNKVGVQDIQVVVLHGHDIEAVVGVLDQKVELDTVACLAVQDLASRSSVPSQDAVDNAEEVVDAVSAADAVHAADVLEALQCRPYLGQASLDGGDQNDPQPS